MLLASSTRGLPDTGSDPGLEEGHFIPWPATRLPRFRRKTVVPVHLWPHKQQEAPAALAKMVDWQAIFSVKCARCALPKSRMQTTRGAPADDGTWFCVLAPCASYWCPGVQASAQLPRQQPWWFRCYGTRCYINGDGAACRIVPVHPAARCLRLDLLLIKLPNIYAQVSACMTGQKHWWNPLACTKTHSTRLEPTHHRLCQLYTSLAMRDSHVWCPCCRR
jgi:hypothetical protein